MQPNQASNTELTKKLERIEGDLILDPGNRDLLASAIDTYMAVGRIEDARRHVDTATISYPDDPYFQHRLGNVLLAEGSFGEAGVIFAHLFHESANINVGFNLAYVHYCQSRYQDASDLLSTIAEQPDRPAGSVTLLLRTCHHLGEIKRAIDLVQRNVAACKNEPDFLAVASLLYFDDGQLERARQLSSAAFVSGTRPLEALVVSGHIALVEGDIAAANAQFMEAIEISPKDGRSWAGLGLVSMLKHDLVTASGQLDRAVVYMPTHIGTRHILGWCKILSHDLRAADEIFEQALSLDRNFGESHGGLAVVYALRGDRLMAEDSIRRALGLGPKGLSVRYAQMVLSGDIDDPVKFREAVFKALSAREGPFGQNLATALANFR